MQKILVVEDDLDIQELLKNFLQEAGYSIVLANDGVEALSIFSDVQFDLILLDIMLPKIDGFAVCELIRKQSQVPIIMLTALNGEEEQIRGLDMQVDDYITKPFSMPVLIRKIAAVLRRSTISQNQEHQTVAYKNLILDLDSYSALVNGESYELTQREFEILRELLLNQGRVLTRRILLERLWKYDFYGDERVVDTHIKKQKKAWKQNEVKISGTKASLITVVFHSSFGENENELFIGHAGVLVPTKDKKLLFVEKLSFSLPYQVLKFDNRKQLKNYLMGMYDTSWGQEEAKPFIMENTKTVL